MTKLRNALICATVVAGLATASPAKTHFIGYKNIADAMNDKNAIRTALVKPAAAAKTAAIGDIYAVTGQKIDENLRIGTLSITPSDVDKFDGAALFTLPLYGYDIKVPLNGSDTIYDITSGTHYKISVSEALWDYTMGASSFSYTLEEIVDSTVVYAPPWYFRKDEEITCRYGNGMNTDSVRFGFSDVDRITGDAIFTFYDPKSGGYLMDIRLKPNEPKNIIGISTDITLNLNEVAAGMGMKVIFAVTDIYIYGTSTEISDITSLRKDEALKLTNGDSIVLSGITLNGTAMFDLYDSNGNRYGGTNIREGTNKSITLSDGTSANVEVTEVGLGYTMSTMYASIKTIGVSIYSTIHQNQSLMLSSGYKVMLNNVTASGASLDILDPSGTKIGSLVAQENSVETIDLEGGKTARIAIGTIAPGYAINSMWAELAELPSDIGIMPGNETAPEVKAAPFVFANGSLRLGNETEGNLTIYNNVGEAVFRENVSGSSVIGLNGLPSGLYVIQYVEDGTGAVRTQKFVIAK